MFIVGFLIIGGGVWAIRHSGFVAGEASKQAEWDKSIQEDTDKKLDVKEKQDEIQRAPIDARVTMRRLRAGTF
jgi:hypothetical protein